MMAIVEFVDDKAELRVRSFFLWQKLGKAAIFRLTGCIVMDLRFPLRLIRL